MSVLKLYWRAKEDVFSGRNSGLVPNRTAFMEDTIVQVELTYGFNSADN